MLTTTVGWFFSYQLRQPHWYVFKLLWSRLFPGDCAPHRNCKSNHYICFRLTITTPTRVSVLVNSHIVYSQPIMKHRLLRDWIGKQSTQSNYFIWLRNLRGQNINILLCIDLVITCIHYRHSTHIMARLQNEHFMSNRYDSYKEERWKLKLWLTTFGLHMPCHSISTFFVWISNLCFIGPSNYIVNKQGCIHQMPVAVWNKRKNIMKK